MKRLTGCILIVVILLVLVTGCTTQTEPQPAQTVIPTAVPTTVSAPAAPAPEEMPVTDSSLEGTWYLIVMSEQGGTAQVQMISPEITLIFADESTLSGYSGCNNYQGSYILTGEATGFGKGISIQPLAVTKKACIDSETTEATYLEILQAASGYLVNVNEELTLTDDNNNSLVYQRTPYSETAVPVGS